MEHLYSPIPEPAKHLSPVQILSLVLGIVGFAIAFVTAAIVLWTFVRSVIAEQYLIRFALVPFLLALLFGLAAIVLGIVGLALDRRQRQRTSGLVLSVVGLYLGASDLIFLALSGFWTGLFTVLFRLIAG